jgi:hypothetical protein
VVVPLWDLEAGQYSLSVAVSIYLSTLIAEEELLSYSYRSMLVPAGGGASDGQGAGGSSGDRGGSDGIGEGFSDGVGESFSPLSSWREQMMARGKGLRTEGRDRDKEGVAQDKGVGGREQLRKDTPGGAREVGGRARGGRGGGRGACGGDEHGQALQEWREKQRGEKREQGRGWIGGSEVEDERWGQGWNCAAVGGEMGAGGSAQRLDTAMANVLWASTQATFTLE